MERTTDDKRSALLPSHPSRTPLLCSSVVTTAAPLLLAIAGSSLTPLPCAFSLAGVSLGSLALCSIGIANNYTSVLMVRAASRLGVSGYEEVVLAAGGRQALKWCRVALVILLFGSMCGCLAAIQETAGRAAAELGARTGYALPLWLSASGAGRIAMLVTLTVFVLLPLSLASLGELPCVSLLGVVLMVAISVYVVGSAVTVRLLTTIPPAALSRMTLIGLPQGGMALTEAASTFGYAVRAAAKPPLACRDASGRALLYRPVLTTLALACPHAHPPPSPPCTSIAQFYVQPCAVPLLRTLPAGERGASTLVAALHVTFVATGIAYLAVGLGGLFFFGEGAVPQDLLQGFHGRVGGSLAAVFCVYLMLCFSPTVVPLRETLVRLHYESSMHYFLSESTPRAPRPDGAVEACREPSPHRSREEVTAPPPRPAVLPPVQNALLTASLVGLALGVAALLPNASAQIFAVTGATGVCCIGYIFPIYSYWRLPEELGGAADPADSPTWGGYLGSWLTARAWPALVLGLGVLVSLLTLVAIFKQWTEPGMAGMCAVD